MNVVRNVSVSGPKVHEFTHVNVEENFPLFRPLDDDQGPLG